MGGRVVFATSGVLCWLFSVLVWGPLLGKSGRSLFACGGSWLGTGEDERESPAR